MNIVFFNDKAPGARPVDRWGAEHGHDVYLVTDKRHASTYASQAHLYRDIAYVSDFASLELERTVVERSTGWSIDRLCCIGEFDLLRAAEIRELTGVPGQSVASVLDFRDKLRMKDRMQGHVATPRYRPVNSFLDILRFGAEVGFPVVVKHRFGGGSLEVVIVHSHDDLPRLAHRLAPGELEQGLWMVEAFVDGDLYHVNGVMSGPTVEHGWVWRDSSGNLQSLRDEACLVGTMLTPDDPFLGIAQRFTAQVLAALDCPTEPTPFHLELFRVDDDCVFCEVACRAGGGGIRESHEAVFGYDLSQVGVLGQIGVPFRGPTGPVERWAASVVLRAPVGSVVQPGLDFSSICRDGTEEVMVVEPPEVGAPTRASASASAGGGLVVCLSSSPDRPPELAADAVEHWKGHLS